MCSDIGVLKEGKPPKKADKTLVSLCFGKNLDSPPPKKVGETIVPLFRSPPVKNIQTINNQSIRAGTMWNNVEQ